MKVTGFVASAPGFNGQPQVVNGASELLIEVFGEDGRHARSAVGVAELPLDAPVEVELIAEVAADRCRWMTTGRRRARDRRATRTGRTGASEFRQGG